METLLLKQKDTMKGYTLSFKMESISIHNYLFINFPTIPHMNEIDREKMQQHDVNTESTEIVIILHRIGSFWL